MDLAAFVDHLENQIPFHAFLGLKVRSLGDGCCELAIPFRPELLGHKDWGALHGGVISSLVDTCGGAALASRCVPERTVTTIDLRVDYMRPALGCEIVARGEIRQLGSRVGIAHTVIFDPAAPGVLLAEGRGVYSLHKV